MDKTHFRIDSYFENIKKYIFDESGHAPHIEEPDKFLDIYLDFIKLEENA